MQSSHSLPIRQLIIQSGIVIALVVIFAGVTLSQVCGGYGTKVTNTSSGTEFLLCFMQNEEATYDLTNSRYQDIYLASTGDVDTVTITCKALPLWSHKVILGKNEAVRYRLSTDPGLASLDAVVESHEVVDATVFRVKSTANITCYGMNCKQFTADAFLALPRNTATGDYRVMSYYNSTQIAGAEKPSEFVVAAFEDSTPVTIEPSALTEGGTPAGVPMQYVLNAGECVQIQAYKHTIRGDLTGSKVMSTRADRPIVVYGGHVRSDLPEGFTFIDQQGNARTSRDHLAEAMPPLSTWGKTFVAKNFGRSAGDIIRVLASVDGTTIKLNGKPWGGALKGGQYMDYLIELSDTALNNIVSVESNHPILVGMLAHTAIGTDGSGDPFLAVVTPLEQSFNDYTYFISTDDVNFNPLTHYVTVATEKSGVGTISIDGIKQPAQAYTNIPIALKGSDGVTRNCAVATFQQTPGIHRIVSPNKEEQGFTILAYGFGSVISYGYTAGSLLKTLTGIAAIDRPTPGVSPGGPGGDTKVIPPGILVRNISNERIYFDSAIVSYTQNKQHVAVRLKKDISTEIGTIEMCEEKDLELTTSQELTETVAGKIRVYYHSRQWTDLYPVDFPFVITPKPQADVSPLEHRDAMIENYPNPVSLATTVHFRLPLASSASIKIYDALGRMVRNVVSGQQSSGDHYLQVSCVGLSAGDYTIELSAPMIGISEHHHLIVTQ